MTYLGLKRFILIVGLVMFGVGTYMLFSNFLKPCGPTRGSGMDCDFSQGKLAQIDSPARITIAGSRTFTISYKVDGVVVTQTPPYLNGFYLLSFTTSGPIEILMEKSTGGISTPSIYVDALSPEAYPTLEVTRTWNHPLEQLWKWYLFPIYMMYLMLALYFIGSALRIKV